MISLLGVGDLMLKGNVQDRFVGFFCMQVVGFVCMQVIVRWVVPKPEATGEKDQGIETYRHFDNQQRAFN